MSKNPYKILKPWFIEKTCLCWRNDALLFGCRSLPIIEVIVSDTDHFRTLMDTGPSLSLVFVPAEKMQGVRPGL